MSEQYDWMPEARQYAAQCWCDPETSHLVMDPVLAEAIALRIAAWLQTSAQHARNEVYYRELIEQCGRHLPAAYVQDDGGIVPEVLCAKVPEVVEQLRSLAAALAEALEMIRPVIVPDPQYLGEGDCLLAALARYNSLK